MKPDIEIDIDEQQATEQKATEQQATEQQATEQQATEQQVIEEQTTEQQGFWDLPQPNKQPTARSSVFRDPPANLAPPSQQPTQATWLKMVGMMDNLNQMMKEMRQTRQYL